MKRNFILPSFICGAALSLSLAAYADFNYHAEIPKDNKVPTDYLEKRKALAPTAPDAQSWQRQVDEAQAREDAEAARRKSEKKAKCEEQAYHQVRRIDRDKRQYYVPPPCIGIY
ncbi:hypothetical protein [Yersinia aldovae]|uniref:hypothetical protein n=1 Tax=Yersinia aldovae TaxID=29483 RepID=UPI00119D4742|nr:hypothetical protein [Yersinia aldovae]